VAYSEVTDLLLGNIPLPTGERAIKSKNAVDRAADEIDGALGLKYQTPIKSTGPNQRAITALMRNVNNWLASGRLIQELTASTQGTEIHAYAASLVNQAWMILNKIIAGEIVLDGVPGNGSSTPPAYGPLISNKDSESNVDAFYDRVAPPPTYPATSQSWPPSGVYVLPEYFG
jgi:hypothetical protein